MLKCSQYATQIATGLQTQLVLMLLTEERKSFKTMVSMFARLIRRLTMRHYVQ